MQISNPPAGAVLDISVTRVFDGTSPSSWTDLDLSAVVGAVKAQVILKVLVPNATMVSAYRTNGDTDEFFGTNYSGLSSAKHGIAVYKVVLVQTDHAGKIEWKTTSAIGSSTIDIIGVLK